MRPFPQGRVTPDRITTHCDLNITVVTEIGMFIVSFQHRRDTSIQPSTIGPATSNSSREIATVQIKNWNRPRSCRRWTRLMPSLDARTRQCAAGRRREGGAPMDSTFRPTQSEFPTHLGAASSTVDAMKRSSLDAAIMRPSLGRRALRGLARLLIVFGIGVGTTLAWQSYGDAARAMIANSSPQLGWLAPQTAPVVPTASDVVAPAGAASSDVQQLAFGLAAVRQSVDLLTAQLAAASAGRWGAISPSCRRTSRKFCASSRPLRRGQPQPRRTNRPR